MARLGLGQLCSSDDKQENLRKCTALVEEAVRQRCAVLSLPECFAFMASKPGGATEAAEPLAGELMQHYKALASHHNIWLCLGGFHESPRDNSSDQRLSNSHVVIDNTGSVRALYRKAYLFDADVASTSTGLSQSYRESSTTRPGPTNGAVLHGTPIGSIGLTTCYDLRFPPIYSALRDAGADVVLVPSAFTRRTGAAHWEPLLRARAIENQVWVGAAAQKGEFGDRASYGHSLLVDPFGRVLEDAGEQEDCVVSCEIKRAETDEVREKMPVVKHRRDDLLPVQIFN